MVDSAIAARRIGSNVVEETGHVLETMELWAAEHPMATEYVLTSELQAEQLLLAMAAVIAHTSKDIRNAMDKRMYLDIASQYRKAVIDQSALQLFQEMTEEDQLELYGLKITVRTILLN